METVLILLYLGIGLTVTAAIAQKDDAAWIAAPIIVLLWPAGFFVYLGIKIGKYL